MVDVVDSKSTAGDSVPVRVRSPAPIKTAPPSGVLFLLVLSTPYENRSPATDERSESHCPKGVESGQPLQCAAQVFQNSISGYLDSFHLKPYNGFMNMNIKHALADRLAAFHMPRYHELPNMGLYLEQTTTYINQCLAPLGCIEVTGSMIRNYVKMGLVAHPVKKQYFADQIAHLISITVLKSALSLENINLLFERQRKIYSNQVAYDYFCMEMENILRNRFGITGTVEDIGVTSSVEKEMLRSGVIAVSHLIYINACLNYLSEHE